MKTLAEFLAEFLITECNRLDKERVPPPTDDAKYQEWFEEVLQQGIEAYEKIEGGKVEVQEPFEPVVIRKEIVKNLCKSPHRYRINRGKGIGHEPCTYRRWQGDILDFICVAVVQDCVYCKDEEVKKYER